MKISILFNDLGVFELFRVPCVGELIQLGEKIFTVERIIHLCEPSRFQSKEYFAKIELSMQNKPELIQPEKAKQVDTSFDFGYTQCLDVLKKKLGLKQPTVVEFKRDEYAWNFTIENGTSLQEKYSVDLKTFAVSRKD